MTGQGTVLELTPGPQLLIDDYLVDDIWCIRRSPEQPVKHMQNPIMDCPGGTIIYDEEDRVFKFWYGIGIPGTFEAMGGYAVSTDGITWEKPDLGLVEVDGSRSNNFIQTDGFGSVLKDPHDPDPSRRYKMMTKRKGSETTGGRAFAAFSPDGIHWTNHPGERSIIRNSCDGNGMVIYDESIGKYVNFRRPTIMAGHRDWEEPEDIGFADNRCMKEAGGDLHDPPEGVGFPDYDDFVHHDEAEDFIHRYLRTVPYHPTRALRIYRPSHEGTGCNRRIARCESDDFIHWTEPEVIIRPDELDPPRLYSMDVMKHRGMYLGLLMVFNSWGTRRYPGCPQEDETIDLHLTFSRDGWRWERLANRPVFLQRGYIGAFDGGMMGPSNPPFIEYGDELRIYYTGYGGAHNVGNRGLGLGVARLPKDRIVARVGGDELGVLLTKPFRLDGNAVTINANASRGLIRVELTDAIGQPIDGFGVKDCAEIRGNGFELPVTWGESDLSRLAGQPVRLRFFMQQARLYTFTVGRKE